MKIKKKKDGAYYMIRGPIFEQFKVNNAEGIVGIKHLFVSCKRSIALGIFLVNRSPLETIVVVDEEKNQAMFALTKNKRLFKKCKKKPTPPPPPKKDAPGNPHITCIVCTALSQTEIGPCICVLDYNDHHCICSTGKIPIAPWPPVMESPLEDLIRNNPSEPGGL